MTGSEDQTQYVSEYGHGGNIYRNRADIDFSVSLNPLGMPEEVEETLRGEIASWSAYPDPECGALRRALAVRTGVKESDIVFGNGAAELIYDLVFSLKPRKALICAPAFSEYEAALKAAGCEVSFFTLLKEENFHLNPAAFAAAVTDDTDLVFLCNPNNPTGECLAAEDVRIIEKACHDRQAFLCVDECFVELTRDPGAYSVLTDCAYNPYLGVLRAFTKTYALAGIRLGYFVTSDKELLSAISSLRQPWNVSAPAQSAGLAAITKVSPAYLDRAVKLIASERERTSAQLEKRGFHVIPSAANFILFYSQCTDLFEKCLSHGILIRDCRNFRGLTPGYYRIGLRTRAEDDVLFKVLDTIS